MFNEGCTILMGEGKPSVGAVAISSCCCAHRSQNTVCMMSVCVCTAVPVMMGYTFKIENEIQSKQQKNIGTHTHTHTLHSQMQYNGDGIVWWKSHIRYMRLYWKRDNINRWTAYNVIWRMKQRSQTLHPQFSSPKKCTFIWFYVCCGCCCSFIFRSFNFFLFLIAVFVSFANFGHLSKSRASTPRP